MSIVIPFAPNLAALRRKSGRPEAGAPRESADILFFTGVRYERQPEPSIDAAPRKRRPNAGVKRLPRTAVAGQTV